MHINKSGTCFSLSSGAYLAGSCVARATAAPSSPVAVSRCKTYEPGELLPVMQNMFDQLGGLGRLVKGKTVAVKINLTGSPTYRLGYLPLEDTYRVPRTVVDLVSARPIHLAIVEGVKTMTGGEGPWIREDLRPAAPGVIVAGTNPVNTDAVATAVMGFDPMADRGTPPFERCDSTLRLAEDVGLGTRDLKRIEVLGTRIQDARFDFAAIRKQRRRLPQPEFGLRG